MNFCQRGHICKISSPIYKVTSYPSCLLYLYLRDKNKIDEHCSLKITKLPPLPYSKYLDYGKWLIYSPIKFDLNVKCGDENLNYVKNIDVGVTDLVLEIDCYAESVYFKLPLYKPRKIEIEKQKLQVEAEIKLNKLSPDLWNQSKILNFVSERLNSSFEQLPKAFNHISDIPIESLHTIMNNNFGKGKEHDFTSYPFMKYIVIFLVILGALILIAWCVLKMNFVNVVKNKRGQRSNRNNVVVMNPQVPPPPPVFNDGSESVESIELTRFLRP